MKCQFYLVPTDSLSRKRKNPVGQETEWMSSRLYKLKVSNILERNPVIVT